MPHATSTSSDALLDTLTALHPKYIDLSLERMLRLLNALGNPQRHTPPIIHIGGTNGKGSVLAYLRAMLTANDMCIHSYQSPHLVRFAERITCAGKMVDESTLADALAHIIKVNAGAPLTFFEATTAAAFHIFAQNNADYLLLEVGLGGRLDATNVAAAYLSIITSIDHDHHEFLGNTLAEIATEKAGILQAHCPAIIAPQAAAARRVIEIHAARIDTSLAFGGRDWHLAPTQNGIVFSDAHGTLTLPRPALVGAHQYINAGCAIAAARYLNLTPAVIAEGLTQARWPARLQNITDNALGQQLRQRLPHAQIWLDGGHNPAAARALAAWAKENIYTPLHIICGLLVNKAAAQFLAAFNIDGAFLHAIPIDGHDCHPPENLVQLADAIGLHAQAHAHIDDALAFIADPDAAVLICGSFYLAGQILAREDISHG